jgi:predicted DNA-binding antitoxin AbrB/MazE fold protein
MSLEIEAVYENGVLKLDRPLPLQDQQRVKLTVQVLGSRTRQGYGLIGWKGDPKVIEDIAMNPDFGINESP